MSKDFPAVPPGATAELDQKFAECAEKWHELVGVLETLAEEYGTYGAMAVMGTSLDKASHNTLVSMVLTGMQLSMKEK